LILFKETLSLVGTSLGSFIFFYVGKESFAWCKWVWSTNVVSIIGLCISFLIQMLQVK
jgi:hypothetical protein